MYIYLLGRDDFSSVPADIMRALGITEFAMELELTADRQLAREDAPTVISNLRTRGFHLQLPRGTSIEVIMASLAKGKH